MKVCLNIANVHFSLPEKLAQDPINKYYQAFWASEHNADIDCDIVSIEPDRSLRKLPLLPSKHCEFRTHGNQFEVTRRNPTGEVLWRVMSSTDFKQFTVQYNESCFFDHYFSIEDLVCRDLGLLLLILFLHTNRGLVFHGSASVLGDEAILCVGKSGVGKSTIARLLSKSGALVLSDERPVVRQWPAPLEGKAASSDFRVYGSPWPSSEGFACNEWGPLKRIYFLEHGLENKLTSLSATEAVARLMQVVSVPSWHDPALFDPCLATAEALLESVPASVLSFRPDEAVVDVIRQDLATDRVAG